MNLFATFGEVRVEALSDKQGSNKMEDDEDIRIADKEWEQTVEVLKLLARGVMVKSIAAQYMRAEKWVGGKKKKALKYPPAIVATLPREVQDYLIRQRPELKGELEEFRQRQSKAVAGEAVSATELAKAKHWEELATLAGQLVSLWDEYNVSHPVGGYYGYIIDDPLMIELPGGLLSSLLIHLKQEFSEFGNIESWKELLKIDTVDELIVKLALVAHRRTLKGTCPFCED